MKKISILIPTYNEELNVRPLSEELISIFQNELSIYDYEIIFIDNDSLDTTRLILGQLCQENSKIKAIFNVQNFGQMRSPYYGLLQTSGDCSILMCADFQDPPRTIIDLVKEWEQGFKVVIPVKSRSKENPFIFFLRKCYYRLINAISTSNHIENFTGFGLYDKEFIAILREIKDPEPYLRGIVGEYGINQKIIHYEQQKRRAGHSKNNWYTLYDIAMLGFVSYSKIPLRLATFIGFLIAGLSGLVILIYLLMKLFMWNSFQLGLTPILLGIFFFGAVQLIFIGILGEYIININTKVINRPLVIESKRINFDK
ncbi:MAG: glycosyltransferase family 2 protein [Brevinema sp.]